MSHQVCESQLFCTLYWRHQIYGISMMSGCNASYFILHAPDLRYGVTDQLLNYN